MSSGETSVSTLSTDIYGDLERLHYFVINCSGDILTELMTSPSAPSKYRWRRSDQESSYLQLAAFLTAVGIFAPILKQLSLSPMSNSYS